MLEVFILRSTIIIVNATSFSPLGITITDSASGGQEVTLTGGLVLTTADGYVHVIELTFNDLNAIKALPDFATSIDNTVLAVQAATYSDTNGTPLLAVSGLQACSIVYDTVKPMIISFSLDLNAGILTITFSEPVLLGSIEPTRIALL